MSATSEFARAGLRALRAALWAACIAAGVASAQRVAFDEFDGTARGGFVEPGLGEWSSLEGVDGAELESDGRLRVARGDRRRRLLHPVERTVVWSAFTMRIEGPGRAWLEPCGTNESRGLVAGFDSARSADEGLWLGAPGVQTNGLERGTTATFLQRYDLIEGRADAWCLAGDALELLNEQGEIEAPPDVQAAPLFTRRIDALRLRVDAPAGFELERLAVAGSAREALTPPTPPEIGAAIAPLAPGAAPRLPEDLAVFVGDLGLLRAGDRLAFYGGELCAEGRTGFVDVLGDAIGRQAVVKPVALLRRGVVGSSPVEIGQFGERGSVGVEALPGPMSRDLPDAAVFLWSIDEWPDLSDPPAFDRAAANLRAWIDGARALGASVVICTPPLSGSARDPRLTARFDQVCQLVRGVAAQRRVQLCDLAQHFADRLTSLAEREDSGLLSDDGARVNRAGAEWIAERVAWAITVAWYAQAASAELALLPMPSTVARERGEIDLSGALDLFAEDPRAEPAASALAQSLGRLGLDAAMGTQRANAYAIRFVLQPTEFEWSPAPESEETYTLAIQSDGATLTAGTALGLARAASTLLQLCGDAVERRDPAGLPRLAALRVYDRPGFRFRGVGLDLTADSHSAPFDAAQVQRWIERASFHKLRHVVLRLVDDSAFAMPSRRFAELCTPQRTPTRDSLRALARFAHARGVELVPEIALPEHAAQLVALRPDLFAIAGSSSTLIDLCNPAAVDALAALCIELTELFPNSAHFVVGGGPSDLEALRSSPHFASSGFREPREALEAWRRRLGELLAERGRRGWIVDDLRGSGSIRATLPAGMGWILRDDARAADFALVDGAHAIQATLRSAGPRSSAQMQGWNPRSWRALEPEEGGPLAALQLDPRAAIDGAWIELEAGAKAEAHRGVELLAPFAERLWNPRLRASIQDFELRRERVARVLRRLGLE